MAARLSTAFSCLLIAINILLASWGLLGSFEYFTGTPLFMPLQNPAFPEGMQFMHWLAISASGLTYLVGYHRRWSLTPYAMIVIYAVMATLCFVQTIDFLTHSGKYIAMFLEYVAYVTIGTFLFRSKKMRERFSPSDQHRSVMPNREY